MGGEGTPPREDIRPDTKLLWPFLFPQSLLPSVDCETKKRDRDRRRIYLAALRVISSYAAENPRSAFFGVTKIWRNKETQGGHIDSFGSVI